MKAFFAPALVLISLVLGSMSCTKVARSTSSLKTVDDDYYAAARSYQSAADTLNGDAQSLRDAASKADEETVRVETAISAAKSFIQGVETSISTVNSEKSEADADASRYAADEAASIALESKYSQQTQSLMNELRDIMQQVYVLENKISIKEEQKAGLEAFAKSIKEFTDLSETFMSAASEMQILAQSAEEQHASWMKQFETLSSQMKPKFTDIVDLDSYRNALASINEFKGRIPGTGQLRGVEARYASTRESILATAQKIRDLGYKLASSKDFSIYLNFYPESKISKQMDAIEQVTRDIGTVSREQVKFHDARNERRLYLSAMVPVAWEKLVKVNLQLNNEKIGIELIKQVETIISSQYVYNSFLKKVNDGSIDYYKFQRTMFAPRRASFVVSDMLEYLAKLESPDRLNALSPEMKSQIVAEIKDAKKVWLDNKSETISSLNPTKIPTFLKEWQRQTKMIGSRLKPTALPSCRNAVAKVLEAPSGDAQTEEAFVLLKTGC